MINSFPSIEYPFLFDHTLTLRTSPGISKRVSCLKHTHILAHTQTHTHTHTHQSQSRTHLYEWHKGSWLPISKNDMSTPTNHGTFYDYMGHELLWRGSQLDGNWRRMQKFPPGLEPGKFHVWSKRDNHYTTETDNSWKTETQCTHRHPVTRKQNKDTHWQRNMGISAHELVDTLL